MKVNKLDFAVAGIAFLTTFALKINLPVWAIFFGWAWYFALGAKPSVFKQAIPPMLMGYFLGGTAIVVNAIYNNFWILAIIVCLTVFLLMLTLKSKTFSCSLASFNAYSILFAGYYAGNFPGLSNVGYGEIYNVIVAIAWFSLANVIGLICGYASVKIGG